MKIRFIVETIRAWDKLNGHSYRAAYITSTLTGKRLFVLDVGGADNIRGQIGRLCDGEAWDAERPRAERHLQQQSHNQPSHQHVAAPPQPSIGVVMGPGDQALFDQIVGVWMLCRDEEERRSLVEHVRSFVEHPEQHRKKAAR